MLNTERIFTNDVRFHSCDHISEHSRVETRSVIIGIPLNSLIRKNTDNAHAGLELSV